MRITKLTLPVNTEYIGYGEVLGGSITIQMGEIEKVQNGYVRVYAAYGTFSSSGSVPAPAQLLISTRRTIAAGASATINFGSAVRIAAGDGRDPNAAHRLFLLVEANITTGGNARASAFAVNYIPERTAPAITAFVPGDLGDASDNTAEELSYLDKYGAYVQGYSIPKFAVSAALDPADPTLTASYALEITGADGGALAAITVEDAGATAVLACGAPVTASGTLHYALTVTDSANKATTQEGTLEVLPYAPPRIAGFEVQRYSINYDEAGDPVEYVADPSGTLVRMDLSCAVAPLNGRNAWEAEVMHYQEGDFLMPVAFAHSAADGAAFAVSEISDGAAGTHLKDKNGAALVVPANEERIFQLMVTDSLGNYASMVSVADTFTPPLEFGRRGFSLGMGCTGTEDEPRFQSAWPADFFAGINGVNLYGDGPTGGRWIDGRPIYRRVIDYQEPISDAVATIIDTIPGVGALIQMHGCCVRKDDYKVPLNNYWSSSVSAYCEITDAGGVKFRCDGYDVTRVIAVIDYIKVFGEDGYWSMPRMGSSNEKGIVLSASGTYSSDYPAYKAFNGGTADYWASANNATNPWIQAKLPFALRNITVELMNNVTGNMTAARVPLSGTISGSNDGETWAELATFTGRPTESGVNTTVHELGNDAAYSYVRVTVAPKADGGWGSSWTGFSEIYIDGFAEV